MIKSIELKNWKTHKDTMIEFRKGVNVLIGIMGSGKSSVVDAVSYALFGNFPDLASKRVSLSNIIMNRPSHERSAEVRLVFEAEGSAYCVTRRISPKSPSEAVLEHDGRYLQTQPERVTETIQELLKVDYDTFSRAIYAQQNQLNYFLDLAKGERKRSIDEMLGLDNFATAEENITSLINSTRAFIEAEQQTLSGIDIEGFTAQLEGLAKEKRDTGRMQEKLALESRELKGRMDETSKRLTLARKDSDAKRRIGEEILKMRSKESTLAEEIKKIDSLHIDEKDTEKEFLEGKAKASALEGEINGLRAGERRAQKELSDAEAALNAVNGELQELERLRLELKGSDIGALEESLDRETKSLEKMKEENLARKAELSEASRWSKELGEHLSKCPICERELPTEMRKELLNAKKRQIAQLGGLIAGLSLSIAKQDGALKGAKAEIEELRLKRERLERYSGSEKRSAELKGIVTAKAKAREASAETYDKKHREYSQFKEKLEKLSMDMEKLSRKRAYLAEIGKLRALAKEKEAEHAAIRVDDQLIYALQEELTGLSAKEAEAASRIESNKRYLSSVETQIQEKQKTISSFRRIEEQIARKRSMLSSLNIFKGSLIETEAALRDRLVSSINAIMQSIWPELYPYADYSTIKLEAKMDDYLLETNTQLDGADSWVSIDSIASGGERSIACLTMRIALAMVIVPNLKWLILDEPTHSIDSNGIEKLISVLSDTLPKVVEQVFIITHDESLKQIADSAVFQLERDKTLNAPTTVQSL